MISRVIYIILAILIITVLLIFIMQVGKLPLNKMVSAAKESETLSELLIK